MLDTKGPEIRLGKFSVDEVVLKAGDTYTFTTEEILEIKKFVLFLTNYYQMMLRLVVQF